MTRLRRLVAVVAFIGVGAWISSTLQGQSGKKPAGAGTTPQLTPSAQISQLAEASESRFAQAGVQTYQPIKGDAYFALQLQPKLEPIPVRPRDYLIVLSTAASQAGPSWIAGHQIADAIIQTATEADRICLMTANEPKATKLLTTDFLLAKDPGDSRKLRDAIKQYREREWPGGTADLKNALAEAVRAFDNSKDRQRIILFLGDGQSTFNPMSEAERQALARTMVDRKIAFFPVPLGVQLSDRQAATTLHGLANATGGFVLRTRVEEERLPDALKRYDEAFKAPILYSAKIQLPADMADICPSELPPLRGDSPTLVVGRMKKIGNQIDYVLTGTVGGQKGMITIKAAEKVLPANLDNYFLVSLVDQWKKAKETPAVLRADRALALAYEQTRLQHQEFLESAQLALEDGKFDAARRIFERVKVLSPDDAQADAGIKIVDRLKDGTLNKDMLRKEFEKRNKGEQLKIVDGKARWEKVDLVRVVQDDKDKAPGDKNPGVNPKQPNIAPENLLKEARDRQAVEEQKVTQLVEDAIRQANRDLRADPDGALDALRNLLNRVKDHPELSAQVRNGLSDRLQTQLRSASVQVQRLKLTKQSEAQAAAVTQALLVREQERKTFEDRVEAQFRLYKNLMTQARFERKTMSDIVEAMAQIQDEARSKGFTPPTASKAMYDIALAAYPLQQVNSLIRQREEKYIAIMMTIEKSHIPYPDEPGIYFPPLATWKALMKARKDKYEVSSLPDDEKGRLESTAIYRMLQEPVDIKGVTEKVKLKTALEYFADRFGGKLAILIDKDSFSAELGADAPDPYEEEVVLPMVPGGKMVLNTALRLILSQVGKGNATYLIRRNFIEITTITRYLADKVIRIYPVGDLVIPISSGQMGMAGGAGMPGGGGMAGMPGMAGMAGMAGMPGMGGMAGMAGMAGMPGMAGMMGMAGMGMAGMAGMGMGMPGMAGMAGMAGMGMGMPGMAGMAGMAGMGMGMPGMAGMAGMAGMGMGMPGMAGMAGMAGMGMPGMGMAGMGGMGMGMAGMGGFGGMGNMQGGAFQAGFNGSLGAMGATQAASLISLVTRIVDPGNWNRPPLINQFAMLGMPMFPMMFPNPGMVGMVGMVGMMGNPGMIGAGPPPDPNMNADPQTSNSIDFFPPALALIVRAPSRVHTSITGGIVGGKAKRLEAAAQIEQERKDALAQADPKDPKIKIAPAAGADNDPKAVLARAKEKLDPTKVWNESFARGGVDPGLVIATADFLFENGEFKHAAELLKANLRYGVVVRPWVFEALAIALEASGGLPEEIQRARLSGIALDPSDAQGFMSAARAMAERGQFERALSFCKQAAQLEPNDYHPYETALAYAESAKDSSAMEWAVGKLVSQDWPVDNLFIQKNAQKRLNSLADKLKVEKRGNEAAQLEDALKRLNQRDLIVQLVWDNPAADSLAELEMRVKEPCGSICSLEQKQTPGGGIMAGYNLTDKEPNTQYVVAQAFPGEYEITVSRIYGQPLGNRARLIITQNSGTKDQSRRIEIIRLDNLQPVKINLKIGRRTELATISPAATQRHRSHTAEAKPASAFEDLRSAANPFYFGAVGSSGARGGAGAPNQMPSALAAKDSKSSTVMEPIAQNAITSAGGAGVQMTTQVRVSADQRSMDMVIRPFFDMANRNNRPPVNLSGIPGGGN